MIREMHYSIKKWGGGEVGGRRRGLFRLYEGSMVATVCVQPAGVLVWPTGVEVSCNRQEENVNFNQTMQTSDKNPKRQVTDAR